LHLNFENFIVLFFILLILSALFSGAEISFFSLNQLIKSRLGSQSKKSSKRVISLLAHPRRLLISLLIGNTLVNVTAASLAAIMVNSFCSENHINPQIGVIFNVVIVTLIVLVLSEITPKIIAIKNAEVFACRISLFISFIYVLFLPLSYIIDQGITFFIKVFPLQESRDENLLQPVEFQALLRLGEEEGELEKEEREMIHSIFEFRDTIVREIMVPRMDMVCISSDFTYNEVMEVIKKEGHTRVPVYTDTVDKIQGILNAKDLLPFIAGSGDHFELLKLTRPAIFIPESKKIDDLLRLFQKEHQHMAIIVDEYGGTSGLVTLEDVIEEIVGEIRDEYDEEQSLVKKLDERTFLVDAKIDIDSLNEVLNINIPIQDEYDTLGGFILETLGSVPKEKDTLLYDTYQLIMEKVEKNRILLVRFISQPRMQQENGSVESSS
jgi:putative hemolysin